MKKTTRLKSLLLAVLLTTGSAFAEVSPTVETVMQTLKQKYPKTHFKSVSETQLPGIYEVVMGKNVAYVAQDGRYFMFGHLFDMETQKDLTQDKLPEADGPEQTGSIDINVLPLGDAIKTVKGSGERTIYIFSDPDCPYCKQLESNLTAVDNVTIYTYMFPIDSLHPTAKTKAEGVWCSKDRAKAWSELTLKNVVPIGTCDNPIQRNVTLAEKLSIRGTPTIILADGTLIPGSMPAARLNQLLAQVKK